MTAVILEESVQSEKYDDKKKVDVVIVGNIIPMY